jgi:HlyD family secretion protein
MKGYQTHTCQRYRVDSVALFSTGEREMSLDSSQPDTFRQGLQGFQKRLRTRWLLWLLLPGLLVGGGYGIYRLAVVIPSEQQKKQVLTMPVERQTLPIEISANGTVQPERSINVSPKNSGILNRLLVKEGDTVKQGQIIAYMGDSNLQGQLTQAKGQVAQAEANLQKLLAGNRPQDIAQAQAVLEQNEASLQQLLAGNRPQDIAQAQARLQDAQATLNQKEDDLRRNQQLYEAGAISLQTVNQARTARDSAQAQVRVAQQALDLQKAGSRPQEIEQARAKVKQQEQAVSLLKAGNRPEDIDVARAQVTSAKGVLQNIQAQINDTVIRAPFDGVVTKKFSDPGAFVTPTTAASAEKGATSSSILTLASTNQVVANLSENNVAQIRLGQKVTIKADAYPGKMFEGKVNQIAAQATVAQNVTSFEVKVALPDAESQKLLRSGMNVATEFQVGELKNAIVVPTVAVVRQQRATGVFVAGPDNQPVFTRIQTGVTVNNKTEVKSGLKGNERVLITFPPGTRTRSQPRGGVFPGASGGGGGRSGGGAPGGNRP